MKNERPSYLGVPIKKSQPDMRDEKKELEQIAGWTNKSFKDEAGEIVLSDCDLFLLEQWAIGTRKEELGLPYRSRNIIYRFQCLRDLGVEIPKLKEEGFPTGSERRILHALDEGAGNAREISEMTDIYYSCISVHIYNMRHKGLNIPNLERSVRSNKDTADY